MRSTEGRRKATALTLLAAMAAVAAALWQWPSSQPRAARVAAADVRLPSVGPLPSTSPVSIASVAPGGESILPARRVAERAVRGVDQPVPMLVVREQVAIPLPPTPMPIASRPISIALAPAPSVNDRPGAIAAADSAGHAFAHAGVALGDAFRRAGLKTGAAFTRIF